MTQTIPLLLVVAGAVLHAWWNHLVKRSGSGDVLFVWCYSVLSVPLLAGALLWWALAGGVRHGGGLGNAWWAGVASMVLHTTYAVVLQQAYARADLSVVYPVSRGLAPVLVTIASLGWAAAPSAWGWVGMALVILGVGCLAGRRPGRVEQCGGVGLGVLVAAATAGYTLWDAFAVAVLHVAVVPYLALSSAAQVLLLTGVLWRRRGEFRSCLRGRAGQALPIAVLAPLSYALVVLAFRWGSPSMVSTARSLNVAVGSLFAIVLLHERPTRWGLLGIGLVCAGAVASAM